MEFFASSFQPPYERDDLLDESQAEALANSSRGRYEARYSKLDLNQFLIKHPSSTFFMRIAGNRYRSLGLQDADVILIDRALEAKEGALLLVLRAGDFEILRFSPGLGPLHIWGQIIYVIRELKGVNMA